MGTIHLLRSHKIFGHFKPPPYPFVCIPITYLLVPPPPSRERNKWIVPEGRGSFERSVSSAGLVQHAGQIPGDKLRSLHKFNGRRSTSQLIHPAVTFDVYPSAFSYKYSREYQIKVIVCIHKSKLLILLHYHVQDRVYK